MKLRVTFMIVALALAGQAVAHSDAWLTTKTKMALLTSTDVDGTQINVDTNRDVVVLQGNVETHAEAKRAEEIARSVEGVREVRNLIQVVPQHREKAVADSDARLRKRVKAELRSEPSLDDSRVHVQSVNEGVVVLGGEATSLSDHLAAVQVVRGVSGVRRVESEITSPDRLADEEVWKERPAAARGKGPRISDMWLTSAVKLRLLASDDVPGMKVNVDTRHGVVTLFGTVPSDSSKRSAVEEARKVDDVKDVVDALQVVPEERAETVEAKDDEIAKAVEAALDEEPGLKDAKIGVEVKGGVVRLTGTVDSFNQRLRAAVTARTVPGVRSVREDLRVEAAKGGTN